MGRLKSATQSTQQVSYILLTMMMKTLLLLPLLLMVVNCQNTKRISCPLRPGHRVSINCVETQCTVTCPSNGDQVFLTCKSNKVDHIHNVGNTHTVVRCRSVRSG